MDGLLQRPRLPCRPPSPERQHSPWAHGIVLTGTSSERWGPAGLNIKGTRELLKVVSEPGTVRAAATTGGSGARGIIFVTLHLPLPLLSP